MGWTSSQQGKSRPGTGRTKPLLTETGEQLRPARAGVTPGGGQRFARVLAATFHSQGSQEVESATRVGPSAAPTPPREPPRPCTSAPSITQAPSTD